MRIVHPGSSGSLTNRDTDTNVINVGGVLRAAALSGFHDLVRELGGDPDMYLRDNGLDPVDVRDPEAMIPLTRASLLMEHAAQHTKTPTFGLRHGARHDPTVLGILALAIRNAPTVEDAVRTASRYLFVHSPGYELELEVPSRVLSGCATLRFDVRLEDAVPQRQFIDGCLSSIHRITGVLLAEAVPVRGVSVPHTPVGHRAEYRAHFAAPVFFAQPYPALHFADEILGRSMGLVESALHDQAIAYIAARYAIVSGGVAGRVRGALKGTIGASRGTKSEIAELLEIHPRTLQRQLASEGVSFEELRDEVYGAATLRLLRETDIPLSQVAAALGFSEHSAMTRSVRRWYNLTPTQIRTAAFNIGDGR